MNMVQLISIAVVASTLSSCGTRADQGLCEANIKDNLLNPETAEILDFKAMSQKEVMDRMVAGVRSGLSAGAADHYSDEDLKQKVQQSYAPSPDERYYSARVRAEGKLGNTVTSVQTCVLKDQNCNCAE